MSRNFEVLQKAGWRQGQVEVQDHFERPVHPPHVAVEAKRYTAKTEVVRDEAAKLVERIFLRPGLRAPRMVAFSGVNQSSSSWVCARASKVLAAQVNERVCAVDANIQTPTLHSHLGGGNSPAWPDALRESLSLPQAGTQVKAAIFGSCPQASPAQSAAI